MRRLTTLSALIVLIPSLGWGQSTRGQVSVEEYALMTVSELAAAAYSECSQRATKTQQALSRLRNGEGLAARGYDSVGVATLGYATENLEEANIHKDNVGRIRLVVRKQLNGEEPDWMTAYTGADS